MGHSKLPKVGDSRRLFLKQSALTAAALAVGDFITFASPDISTLSNQQKQEIPWYSRVTRWGQINITEMDPIQYDISWWRNFWKETGTEGVVINAGGIVAYYPTKIPFHKQAQYLQGRDLFGELCNAAHEDGLVVFARMDSNRAHEEFYRAHPDWFALDKNNQPYKAADLYISCVNSPYYKEHIPSVLTEISNMYKPEGFTDNSWSGLGRESICYCENCKKSFYDKTGHAIPLVKNWDDPAYQKWIRWNYDRRLEIWDLNNRTTKAAGGKHCIWSGMNSGSLSGQARTFRDFKEICKRAEIIMLDDQSRNDLGGFQRNGDTGKLIHGILGWDKLVPESMAMYQQGRPQFRIASKPEPEARMWMVAGAAGGIQPWWHMISAYHEDRRMYHTPGPFLKWYGQNQQYLINRKPIANVGVVWSQENIDFYGRDNAGELVEVPWRGMTEALRQAKIPYLPVHADHIERDSNQFSVLILPNLAVMTSSQIAGVRKFVENGGSLIATGVTSLYDEKGQIRSDFALGDLFGAHFQGSSDSESELQKLGGSVYHSYLRLNPELRAQVRGPHISSEPAISKPRHSVLQGFEETDILPFGGHLQPLKLDPGAEVLMTFIPQFPIYPPETAWMRTPKTDIPGLVLNTRSGNSRVAFLPADIDRQFGHFNLPDHGTLLENLVRWAVKDSLPLKVEGAIGLHDYHLYQQGNKLVLHVVNLTNTGAWRQPYHEFLPSGPQVINVKLPCNVSGKNLEFLVSKQASRPKVENGSCQFEIKSITDHEVVVIS